MAMKYKENSYLGILNRNKSIIINSMSNISNIYIDGARKESLYQNSQSRWLTNTINMPMSQVKTRELPMCNQEIGNHWSTHQMPHLLRPKFKLDPLRSPVESPFCGPRISAHAFPTWWQAQFWFWKMILLIKKNWLGVATYFYFILKG